jgi:hypothetical protein
MNGAKQSSWTAKIFLPLLQAGLFLFLSKKRIRNKFNPLLPHDVIVLLVGFLPHDVIVR